MKWILILAMAFSAWVSHAASYTLRFAWDLASTNDVTHCRLYWRVPPAIFSTNNSMVFTNIAASMTNAMGGFQPNTPYRFVVTAIDLWNSESAFSSEIAYLTPIPPAPPAPIIFRVITNILQAASSPSGPFTNVVSLATPVPIEGSGGFYRSLVAWGPELEASEPKRFYVVAP